MRLLTAIRHAKSSWDHPELQDFDRPLNRRGLRDAPEMGCRLAKQAPPPDRILSSPAARALATAEALAESIDTAPRVLTDPRIYEAGPDTLTDVLREVPNDVRHLFLVGHNPGLSLWIEELTGVDPGDLPTCAVARIQFDAPGWRDITPGNGALLWIDYPKNKTGTPLEP